jgi:polyphosphate kinase 2 (PPK2 family)
MYREGREALEVALVETHARMVERGERALVIVEGADGSGKTTLVRDSLRYLDPRRCRAVSLGPPDERERSQWYFQRWLAHLPAAGEIVLFDRSWYNRAALEPVHGLCTTDEREAFFDAAPRLERLLVDGGLRLVKIFLAIRRDTQERRLAARAADPRLRWKNTAIDRAAAATWPALRAAHDEMLARTAPWIVIDNNDEVDRRDPPPGLRALVTNLGGP